MDAPAVDLALLVNYLERAYKAMKIVDLKNELKLSGPISTTLIEAELKRRGE